MTIHTWLREIEPCRPCLAAKTSKIVTNCVKERAEPQARSPSEDGSVAISESQRTIIEEDYFRNRHPDLAGDPATVGIRFVPPNIVTNFLPQRRPVCSRRHRPQLLQQQRLRLRQQQQQQPKRHRLQPQYTHAGTSRPRRIAQSITPPLPTPPDSQTHGSLIMADSSQQLTQQATQPYGDHPRFGRHTSNISEDDAADVICLLHPASTAALQSVQATMLQGPQHILQNEDLYGISEEDLLFNRDLQGAREFALRLSSTVRRPQDGFRFGRNPSFCDVLLTSNVHDKLVSNIHFKIFVNGQGSLMLQDVSTNGTIVDDEHLRRRPDQQPMRALKNGSIICVLGDPGRQEIKLLVRIPNRGEAEEAYEKNLKAYLERRGIVAAFASMRESTHGNHWNGGSLYNFTRLLGKGAFALVYLVQTKHEGAVYAAKELDKRRFIKNGILDTKFDSELNIMKDLKHPNIVAYVDCQMYQHWIYIVMEFVPHGELSKELESRKFLTESEVKQIGKQIMRALDYLHRRGITHRDIKPDNILIASRDPLVVKLSDFGLSKCINNQETFLKTFCGTLLYCAPEVYPDYNNYTQAPFKRRRRGEPVSKTSPYDQSVDMWSFGAVLFHVLCGKPPIMGKGDDRGAQMLSNIMTQEVDFRPLRERKVSEAGIDFIARLLNRNPMLRPTEKECLNHAWLQDVPDLFDYTESEQIPDYMIRRELEAVEEELDEDLVDEEMMHDLHRLTQHPLSSDPAFKSTPDEPPIKKARTIAESATIPAVVAYPTLPNESQTVPAMAYTTAPRLFGEIDPSLLQSSGVFGQKPIRDDQGDVRDLGQGIAEVSVNDYGDSNFDVNAPKAPALHTHAAHLLAGQTISAPSLLGAEAQIGQLNMASPEAAPSDAATPDTTHPITPRTRDMSPSSSIDQIPDDDLAEAAEADVRFSRKIDVNLLTDTTAFAASVQAREASRAKRLQQKAESFHVPAPPSVPRFSPELAVTLDARMGLGAANTENDRRTQLFSRTINIPAEGPSRLVTRYGKLTPVAGSCGAGQVVLLERRLTSWGRGIDCHVRYPDIKDIRVPKYAVKITFWAPGIEKHIEKGGDWTQVPGVRSLISTSTSQQIWVNDVELRKESADGKAALYGKVYSGDIITVFHSGEPNEYLKYKVEITFGDSARPRPEKEQPFVLNQEYDHHRQKKERDSMRESNSSDHGREERAATAPAAA